MGRSFLANQLLEAEVELMWVGKHADALGFDVGDLSDELHFDGAPPRPLVEAIATVRELKLRLDRAEGLIRAYSLALEARKAVE
ncbi:MAG TPA: hypothetical protein VIG24_11565 [Acidimicrobiia bacterium]